MTTYTLLLEATPKAARVFQLFFQIPQFVEAKGCPVHSYIFKRENTHPWSALLTFSATPLEYTKICNLIEGYHFRATPPIPSEEQEVLSQNTSLPEKETPSDLENQEMFCA